MNRGLSLLVCPRPNIAGDTGVIQQMFSEIKEDGMAIKEAPLVYVIFIFLIYA